MKISKGKLHQQNLFWI